MTNIERINTFAFYLQNPHLYRWRKFGFNHEQYLKLNSTWLQSYGFTTILDIGANTGQSALAFSFAFPKATVHSFEPLPDCFKQLEALTKNVKNIEPHNHALGSTVGELLFERNSYSASSSLLRMSTNHIKHFPHATPSETTTIQVMRLDDWASINEINGNILVKLDVQGFETQVIRGGIDTLKKAKVIITETSFEHLYEKQPLFDDILNEMVTIGFQYKGSFEQLNSPVDGRILQQDAFFVNKKL